MAALEKGLYGIIPFWSPCPPSDLLTAGSTGPKSPGVSQPEMAALALVVENATKLQLAYRHSTGFPRQGMFRGSLQTMGTDPESLIQFEICKLG